MILEASTTARETETYQTASRTEAKAGETWTGRERDRYNEGERKRDRQPDRDMTVERWRVAKTTMEIETGNVAMINKDRQYALMQRPSKQFNIQPNKNDNQ